MIVSIHHWRCLHPSHCYRAKKSHDTFFFEALFNSKKHDCEHKKCGTFSNTPLSGMATLVTSSINSSSSFIKRSTDHFLISFTTMKGSLICCGVPPWMHCSSRPSYCFLNISSSMSLNAVSLWVLFARLESAYSTCPLSTKTTGILTLSSSTFCGSETGETFFSVHKQGH